jgi:hypothetical protein
MGKHIECHITESAPDKSGMCAHGSEWMETHKACGNRLKRGAQSETMEIETGRMYSNRKRKTQKRNLPRKKPKKRQPK